MNRTIKISFFVLALLALGFFRETLFVSINSILYDKFYKENHHHVVWFLFFVNALSYQTVYIAKWVITPLFVFFLLVYTAEILTFYF